MLDQRRRRWANIDPALAQHLAFAGYKGPPQTTTYPYRRVFADLDAKAMYECTDKLEKECSPLSRPMTPDAEDEDDEDDDKMDEHDEPKNGTSGEQDGNDGDDEKDDDMKDDDMNMPSKKAAPFSAMFVHQMALSCGDGR